MITWPETDGYRSDHNQKWWLNLWSDWTDCQFIVRCKVACGRAPRQRNINLAARHDINYLRLPVLVSVMTIHINHSDVASQTPVNERNMWRCTTVLHCNFLPSQVVKCFNPLEAGLVLHENVWTAEIGEAVKKARCTIVKPKHEIAFSCH